MLYPNSYAWYNIYYSGSVKSYDKEAAKLINEFGTFDELLANKDQISNVRIKNLIHDHEESAKISHQLVILKNDCAILPISSFLFLNLFRLKVFNVLSSAILSASLDNLTIGFVIDLPK